MYQINFERCLTKNVELASHHPRHENNCIQAMMHEVGVKTLSLYLGGNLSYQVDWSS